MMATATQTPLIIQDENLNTHPKKGGIHAKKSSQPAVKKGGVGRKALNDITNKSSVPRVNTSLNGKGSLKKTTLPQEFNVAEERFLHDHSKCFEAQAPTLNTLCSDILLLKPYIATAPELFHSEKAKLDLEFKEPEEMPECDWTLSSSEWCSPPCSPSPPSSPIWLYKDADFVLKAETES